MKNQIKHIFDTRTKTIYLLNNILWLGKTNDKKFLKIYYNNGSTTEIWAGDRTVELVEKISEFLVSKEIDFRIE